MAAHEVLLDRYLGDDHLVVEVAWATWDLSVFSVSHGEASGVVAVPRPQLEQFLDDLWAGRLDERLTTDVRSRRVQRRRLASSDDASKVAVYGGVSDPTRLLPRERDVLTGRVQPPGGPRGRESKRRSEDAHRPPRPRRLPPRVLVAGAVVSLVVVAGSALALSGGGEDPAPVIAGGSTTSTTSDQPARYEQLYYKFTVTVTSFEGEEVVGPPPASFTVGYFCGGQRVTDQGNIPHCSSDPRDAYAYFAPAFDLPVPRASDFEFERPLPTCTPGKNDSEGAGIIIDLEGYGTDTMTGTYEAGYEYLQCALDPSGDVTTDGYAIGYRMTASFVAELVDELVPTESTTTTFDDGADFGSGPAPAPPVINGSAGT
jgi:hypothetical protein